MTEAVVHQLEAIEIHEKCRCFIVLPKGTTEILEKQPTVCQIGQSIVMSDVLNSSARRGSFSERLLEVGYLSP